MPTQVLSHYRDSGLLETQPYVMFGQKAGMGVPYLTHLMRKAFSRASNRPYQHTARLDCMYR